MDPHQYLIRIKYAGGLDPNVSVLTALQEAHLLMNRYRLLHQLLPRLLFTIVASLFLISVVKPQEISTLDRERGQTMLRVIRKDIEEHFYDNTYKGINLDTLFAETAHRIDMVMSNNELFTVIAEVMNEFRDSHMLFVPPRRTASVHYGWTYQMIGDSCYVTGVKPGSDAQTKGLRVGDRILAIGRTTPTRENDFSLRALLTFLNPQPGMRVLVRTANDPPHEVVAMAEMKTHKKVVDLSGQFGDIDLWDYVRDWETQDRLLRHRHHDLNDSVHIWKMTDFLIDEDEVNDAINDVEDMKALILDLRGNRGGYVETLDLLIARLFDHTVKVGDLYSRTEKTTWLVEASSQAPFQGLLVVLVDSRCASAAEVLARLVQLERRGIVIGDRTSGAVSVARSIMHDVGVGSSIFYGANVTIKRHVMSDGGSLEGIGVLPDELLLPTSSDLAQGRDPVLSYAAWLVGSELSPEAAGKLFPVEWRK